MSHQQQHPSPNYWDKSQPLTYEYVEPPPLINRKLWLPWITQLVEALACLYGICLFALWLIDGSDTSNSLHIGYWFSWQILWMIILLPPYLIAYKGTFDGVKDNSHALVKEQAKKWIHIRTFVQFAASLAAISTDIVFFVLRVIEFIGNCEEGSLCGDETATFAIATGASAIQAIIGLALAYFIAQCYLLAAGVSIPAPPQKYRPSPLLAMY